MGISKMTIDLAHKAILEARNTFKRTLWMCEFGQQKMRGDTGVKYSTAKKYFESLGIKHTSIDKDGLYGSLPIDLSKKIEDHPELRDFDIVTNFGTIEHVRDCQYWAFANMHNLCTTKGLMVHAMPMIGSYSGHCQFRYSTHFMNNLAAKNDYELLLCEPRQKTVDPVNPRVQVCCIFRKLRDREFMSQEDFYRLEGVQTG